jgi:hypothetical protein
MNQRKHEEEVEQNQNLMNLNLKHRATESERVYGECGIQSKKIVYGKIEENPDGNEQLYYKHRWETSEEELSEDEAIAFVSQREDPDRRYICTGNTLSRYSYLLSSGHDRESALLSTYVKEIPVHTQWSSYFFFRSYLKQLKDHLRTTCPANTELEATGEVEVLLRSFRNHILFCLPSLRGACYLPQSTFVRVKHSMSATGWHDEENYLLQWPILNRSNLDRVRCVYCTLTPVVQGKSSTLQFLNQTIQYEAGDVVLCKASTKRRFTQASTATISFDFRVLLPPLYDFFPHVEHYLTHPSCSWHRPLEQVVCLAALNRFRSVELVARMLLYTYGRRDDTIHVDVENQWRKGNLYKVCNSSEFARQLATSCYGGFLGSTKEVVENASKMLQDVEKKRRERGVKANKRRALALTHGAQYCMWWTHRPHRGHYQQYLAACKQLVEETTVVHYLVETPTHIERVDLYLECLVTMPVPYIRSKVDVDDLKRFSNRVLDVALQQQHAAASPDEQLLHLLMMVYFVIMKVEREDQLHVGCAYQTLADVELESMVAVVVEGKWRTFQYVERSETHGRLEMEATSRWVALETCCIVLHRRAAQIKKNTS